MSYSASGATGPAQVDRTAPQPPPTQWDGPPLQTLPDRYDPQQRARGNWVQNLPNIYNPRQLVRDDYRLLTDASGGRSTDPGDRQPPQPPPNYPDPAAPYPQSDGYPRVTDPQLASYLRQNPVLERYYPGGQFRNPYGAQAPQGPIGPMGPMGGGYQTAPGQNLTPQQLQPMYEAAGRQYGVDPNILRGMAQVESGQRTYGPNGQLMTSNMGAKGLMQFVDGTATEYGVNVNDPWSSIQGAARYMAKLIRDNGGDVQAALQEYNGATGDRTFSYARKVLAASGQPAPPQSYINAGRTPGLAARGPSQWGTMPPLTSSAPGLLPTAMDLPRLMQLASAIAPLLSGHGTWQQAAMLRAFQGLMAGAGQNQSTLARQQLEQFQLQQAQHAQQIQDENRQIGEVMASYQGDPEGMNRALGELAVRNNDNALATAVQHGPDAVNHLMQARDRYAIDQGRLKQASEADKEAEAQQQEITRRVQDQDAYDREQFRLQNGRDPDVHESEDIHWRNLTRTQQEAGLTKGQGSGLGNPKIGNYTWVNQDGSRGGPSIGSWVPSTGQLFVNGQPVAARPNSVREVGEKEGGEGGPNFLDPGGPDGGPPPSPRSLGRSPSSAAQPNSSGGGAPASLPAPQAPPRTGAAPGAAPAASNASPPATSPAGARTNQWGGQITGASPTFDRLSAAGQRMARDYLEQGNSAIPTSLNKQAGSVIQAGEELRAALDAASQSGGTPDENYRRMRAIDPESADYFRGISNYTIQPPTAGRAGAARLWPLTMAQRLNPQYSDQNYRDQQAFKNPGGAVQKTLRAIAPMGSSGQQVREALLELPPELKQGERWKQAMAAFANNVFEGDPRYTKLFVSLRQYVQEANVVTRGGSESVTETREQLGGGSEGGARVGLGPVSVNVGGAPAPFSVGANSTPAQILTLLQVDARNALARLSSFREQWQQMDGQGAMRGDSPGDVRTFQDLAAMNIPLEAQRGLPQPASPGFGAMSPVQ